MSYCVTQLVFDDHTQVMTRHCLLENVAMSVGENRDCNLTEHVNKLQNPAGKFFCQTPLINVLNLRKRKTWFSSTPFVVSRVRLWVIERTGGKDFQYLFPQDTQMLGE